jgi:hypothetical protein
MSSHLDYRVNIVDNGNFSGDGSSLIMHHLQKWMRDFVERMVIHNTFAK